MRRAPDRDCRSWRTRHRWGFLPRLTSEARIFSMRSAGSALSLASSQARVEVDIRPIAAREGHEQTCQKHPPPPHDADCTGERVCGHPICGVTPRPVCDVRESRSSGALRGSSVSPASLQSGAPRAPLAALFAKVRPWRSGQKKNGAAIGPRPGAPISWQSASARTRCPCALLSLAASPAASSGHRVTASLHVLPRAPGLAHGSH